MQNESTRNQCLHSYLVAQFQKYVQVLPQLYTNDHEISLRNKLFEVECGMWYCHIYNDSVEC
jgi:hypothetical protein